MGKDEGNATREMAKHEYKDKDEALEALDLMPKDRRRKFATPSTVYSKISEATSKN